MKKMMKLLVVLLLVFGNSRLMANQPTIRVEDYNDELKYQLSLNYEFVDSQVLDITENVAVEYHVDDLVVIVDYSSNNKCITIYVNNYNSYEKFLEKNNNTTSKLLNNCIEAKNTDNVFGASVIYKEEV